ncbi:Rrf2 family transcriptional regulator [Catenulispora yoronensis]
MQMGEGVEWGLHCLMALVWLEEQGPVAAGRLAEVFELPPEYLKKRLQPLVRAGILASTPGARGGYSLARAPEKITLMDVVAAVEGREDAFRCTEIRQQGAGVLASVGEFGRPCGVAAAMRRAEMAWRRELAAQTLADLLGVAPAGAAGRVRRFHQSR